MDLNFLIFAFPTSVILCFQQFQDEHVFVIIYAIVASYFVDVMVRLMLTLTPVVCVSAAIAVSTLLAYAASSSRSHQPISAPYHLHW